MWLQNFFDMAKKIKAYGNGAYRPLFIETQAGAGIRTCVCARRQHIFAIDKNGVLSFIWQKKYPSCIVKKIFNENAK